MEMFMFYIFSATRNELTNKETAPTIGSEQAGALYWGKSRGILKFGWGLDSMVHTAHSIP